MKNRRSHIYKLRPNSGDGVHQVDAAFLALFLTVIGATVWYWHHLLTNI